MPFILHTENGKRFVCNRDVMQQILADRPTNAIVWVDVTEMEEVRTHSLRIDKIVSFEFVDEGKSDTR